MQRKSIIKRSVRRGIRPKKKKSEKMMIKSRLFSHVIDSEFDYNGEISVEISANINLFASTRRWHRKRIIILTLKNRRIPMHENPTAASQGRTRCIWAKTPIHVLRKPRPAIWNKELNNLALKIVGNFETQHGRYFGRDETTWFVSGLAEKRPLWVSGWSLCWETDRNVIIEGLEDFQSSRVGWARVSHFTLAWFAQNFPLLYSSS